MDDFDFGAPLGFRKSEIWYLMDCLPGRTISQRKQTSSKIKKQILISSPSFLTPPLHYPPLRSRPHRLAAVAGTSAWAGAAACAATTRRRAAECWSWARTPCRSWEKQGQKTGFLISVLAFHVFFDTTLYAWSRSML